MPESKRVTGGVRRKAFLECGGKRQRDTAFDGKIRIQWTENHRSGVVLCSVTEPEPHFKAVSR
jgi:hypothetical protein